MESPHGRQAKIDSVRAMAALAIFMLHALSYGGANRPDRNIRDFLFPAEVGVVIFLVLSGFLLFRPFVRAHVRGSSPPAIGSYTIRRLLRILPAYWVALAISAVIFSWTFVWHSGGLITYFGLTQAYHGTAAQHGILPAWTLGLELSFYALLPVWAWLMRRVLRGGADRTIRGHYIALTLLFAASVTYKFILYRTGNLPAELTPALQPALEQLPAHLDDFAVGMGLAVFAVQIEERKRPAFVDWLTRNAWICWVVAAVAYLAASLLLTFSYPFATVDEREFFIRTALYWVIAVALVWPAAIGSSGVVASILRSRVIVFLGTISYGIYLWHWPVLLWYLQHQRPLFHSYLSWTVYPLPITLVLATLSYFLVERPAIELGRRIGSGAYRFGRSEAAITESSAP